MDNDVIVLIARAATSVDAYGDTVFTDTTREVFARVGSVGMKEFYQADANGLKPEIKFILADYYEYNGEQYVRWNSTEYKVLRTYRKGQEFELTCYREVN